MRVLIINKWDDEFSDYGAHVDHREHRVAYVTVPGHLPRVPVGTRAVEVVDGEADEAEVLAAARRCREALGGVDVVLALSEFNLLAGGRIRDESGVPGPGAAELLRFRDKPLMKRTVAAAGLRVPRLTVVESAEEVAQFAATVSGATVVKPRSGAAAAGVRVIPPGADPLPYLTGTDFTDLHAEEFVRGALWHVDGLMRSGAPWFACASRYLGTPLGLAAGEPTASVCDDGPDGRRILDFALRCLAALDLTDGAFHLEAIDAPDGPVFLEVGARVGGGMIPWTLAEVHGFDLVGEWIRLQMGQAPTTTGRTAVGGALLVPAPAGRRVRVDRVRELVGEVPGLYAQVSAEVGKVLNGEDLIAGLRFRGTDTESVVNAMDRALRRMEFEVTDVGETAAAAGAIAATAEDPAATSGTGATATADRAGDADAGEPAAEPWRASADIARAAFLRMSAIAGRREIVAGAESADSPTALFTRTPAAVASAVDQSAASARTSAGGTTAAGAATADSAVSAVRSVARTSASTQTSPAGAALDAARPATGQTVATSRLPSAPTADDRTVVISRAAALAATTVGVPAPLDAAMVRLPQDSPSASSGTAIPAPAEHVHAHP